MIRKSLTKFLGTKPLFVLIVTAVVLGGSTGAAFVLVLQLQIEND